MSTKMLTPKTLCMNWIHPLGPIKAGQSGHQDVMKQISRIGSPEPLYKTFICQHPIASWLGEGGGVRLDPMVFTLPETNSEWKPGK